MKWTVRILRHPGGSFFLLTFLISWCLWVPAIRPLEGLKTFDVPAWAIVLLLVGGAGPSIAARIVTHTIGGKRAVKVALGGFLRWRVGWRWYAVVILVPVVLLLTTLPICTALSGQSPAFHPRDVLTLVTAYALWFLIALPTGPCLEELERFHDWCSDIWLLGVAGK